jgi:hypothetical protein
MVGNVVPDLAVMSYQVAAPRVKFVVVVERTRYGAVMEAVVG